MAEENKLDSTTTERIKQQIKKQIMPSNGGNRDQQSRLNEITDGVSDIKQHIRQIAQIDAKIAKQLLAKMANLEKLMDDVFPDLIEEI